MTILEFAKLCGCNTQTLRYYDRIGLLKPAQVDSWTGYRHYDQGQAVDYITIKNLQLASFSISEIKELLGKTDSEIYEAFSGKIAEQQEKLTRIQKIQESYRSEKSMIEKRILAIADYMNGKITEAELKKTVPEVSPEELSKIKENIGAFRPEEYDTILKREDFLHFGEVYSELPDFAEGKSYALVAEVSDVKSDKDSLVKELLTIAAGKGKNTRITVMVVDSSCGRNRFLLMRKRQDE